MVTLAVCNGNAKTSIVCLTQKYCDSVSVSELGPQPRPRTAQPIITVNAGFIFNASPLLRFRVRVVFGSALERNHDLAHVRTALHVLIGGRCFVE